MNLEGVSKTAILTLRARAEEQARPDSVYADPKAVEWLKELEWPSELDAWFMPRVQSMLALRAHEFDRFTTEAVKRHQVSCVVELGAGLSTRSHRLRELPVASWIDVDLPGVIEVRRALGVEHLLVAGSVLDDAWMEQVPKGALLIAEGLFYYLPRVEVDALFLRMRERLGGALILFDVLGDMDFDMARKNSTAAGTPILWKVPSFTKTYEDLGVEVVPGWEPEANMRQAIDLYWPRVGWLAHRTAKVLSSVAPLAEMRSGAIAGRLRATGR